MAESTTAKKPAKKAPVAKKITAPKVVKKAAPKAKSDGSFAVIATGGKQYKVSVGDKVKIEKLKGDHKEGDSLVFDEVLLISDAKGEVKIGTPFISSAKVGATINRLYRDKTIEVVKYKSKSRYFKRYGHRQPHFEVVIDSIK